MKAMPTTAPGNPVLLKTDVLEVRQGEQVGFLSARWLRHPSSAEFRENNYLLADLLLGRGCRRLLNDARAVLYLELADQHWLMQQLLPLLSATLLERHACVVSQMSLELMDTDRLLQHFACQPGSQGKTIGTRLFLDPSPARDWLLL